MDPTTSAEIYKLREALARLEDKVDVLFRHLNLDYGQPQAPEPYADEAITLLRQKRDIEAIKLVRQVTNLGLAEAKTIVDGLKRRL